MPLASQATGVAITNPLILYRTLVATKRIDPDPAQHRLAVHLQRLYDRLRDYEPIVEYGHRLQQISRALGSTPGRPVPGAGHDASEGSNSKGVFSSLFEEKQKRESLAVTRVVTSQQAALELDSPKGLMLHGEVGTGKSMLIDLFADCLPNKKKKRWHYSTFMLDTLVKLERLRRSRQMIIPTSLGRQEDYSLLWLARDMISTSPILFLDEFQLPDRAAAKIVTNLMTCFFHLGGVLIATSNRMPEELAKAAGMEFAPPPPPTQSFLGRTLGLRSSSAVGKSEQMFSRPTEFSAFLDVLRARCEVWEMENGKDYRRREVETESSQSESAEATESELATSFEGLENMSAGNIGLGYEQSIHTASSAPASITKVSTLPSNYFLKPLPTSNVDNSTRFSNSIHNTVSHVLGLDPALPKSTPKWTRSTLTVYNRPVSIPRTHPSGVCHFTFDELCGSLIPLGPADYITIASTFHTVILVDVPVLTSLQRNEARRLITLLDALYEARCKLFISADAGPDEIFFPENASPSSATANSSETVSQDATYAETISEVYQDATAPFRPNVAAYTDDGSSSHSSHNPSDQLEDTPPNTPRSDSASSSYASSTSSKPSPDFGKAQAFTGEDERFAYKRARSRLWEMCGSRWWGRSSAPETPVDRPDWWRPLPPEVRGWERPVSTPLTDYPVAAESAPVDGGEGTSEGRAEVEERYSPFRMKGIEPPPKFSWTHAWGMMTWGKKAGAWGKGVEGLSKRKEETDAGQESTNKDASGRS
ncbi:MAG: hypothetical protein M1828_007315 [Chrysothrix sp. TS-e1954]|nr:MAG: hypothetical protein M1828_007315 [Chrysothrix sp. TS-e1954]